MDPETITPNTSVTASDQQTAPARQEGDKSQSKPVRYIVPGIYLTPYGERRDSCLKAIC
jgi:hypothetical protein